MKERITRQDIRAFKDSFLKKNMLFKVEDAAEVLAISPRTLHRRIDAGDIIAYNDNKTGKGVRVLAADLEEYRKNMKIDTSCELESLANF